MCIVFVHQNAAAGPGEYRLVLVNNRDEGWARPTAEAGFWGPRLSCISGLDMHKGKEGGTWLGMNKSGKIAVLLNILGSVDFHKRGRGFIVSDFISGDWTLEDYAAKIYSERKDYNGFNMLLFDVGVQGTCPVYTPMFVTSAPDYSSYPDIGTLPPNVSFGASNSPFESPFQKVVKGSPRFRHITAQNQTTVTKKRLVESLWQLMDDKTPLLPDPIMEKAAFIRGVNPAFWTNRSAINTWSPQEFYGSRTTTIILVDGRGVVDYIERTVDHLRPGQPATNVFKTFHLDPTRSSTTLNKKKQRPLTSSSNQSSLHTSGNVDNAILRPNPVFFTATL